ncbi:MAG: metal ABC transporter ATP-binding protein [Magnetococcales bacterium]|nr:metal ABC transporter ATP-binding protein [Magnetococcales bacterium]
MTTRPVLPVHASPDPPPARRGGGEVPLLAARGVTVRRGGETVLREVDLAIGCREIVTIIGPNGAGKSTLLSALLGLTPLAGGRVERHPRLVVGYVPQRLRIDPALPLTVERFIALSAPGVAPDPELLRRLGCERLGRRPMHGLSGGETQRVLLARALSRRPNLLVLDEPAQGMDMAGEQQLYAFIEQLRQEEGLAALLVSHNLHFVMAGADHVVCLNRHVCCSGTPTAVCATPEFQLLFGEKVPGLGYYQHHHDHCRSEHGALGEGG